MHKEGPNWDVVPFMHSAAIELCSRKVLNQRGDFRLSFDICRRAIDIVELEKRKKLEDEARKKQQLSASRKPLGEKTSVNASPRSRLHGDGKVAGDTTATGTDKALAAAPEALMAAMAPATIAHVNCATSAAFGNGTVQRLGALNLHQRVALCTLLATWQRSWSMSTAAAVAVAATDESPTRLGLCPEWHVATQECVGCLWL